MPIDNLSQWTSSLQTPTRSSAAPASIAGKAHPRRSGHGGSAWSLPFGAQIQRQPQDGATDRLSRLTSITSRLHPSLPQEPEDARLTGGTRSLSRRLLGLNVTKKTQRKGPDVADPLLTTQVA
jgi:hypothetical protein